MRKEIAWISPLRTGIIYAMILAVLYFAFIVLALIFGGLSGGFHRGGFSGMEGSMMLGAGLVRGFLGLIPAIIGGFFAGLISAFVYNVAAGIVGGVVIELRDS